MRTAIFQITGILDNMLLRQLPFVEYSLLSRFYFYFSVAGLMFSGTLVGCWASCNWLVHNSGLRRNAEEINMFGSLMIVLENESGFSELPVAASSWTVYVGCSLRVKEEKACWALINDSDDGMGGGRGGTESSSVAAGCSLETIDISEVSLYIIEDEAWSIGHLAETSCLLAGHYHPLYRNHPTTTPLRIETALSITSLRIKASTSNCDHSNKWAPILALIALHIRPQATSSDHAHCNVHRANIMQVLYYTTHAQCNVSMVYCDFYPAPSMNWIRTTIQGHACCTALILWDGCCQRWSSYLCSFSDWCCRESQMAKAL